MDRAGVRTQAFAEQSNMGNWRRRSTVSIVNSDLPFGYRTDQVTAAACSCWPRRVRLAIHLSLSGQIALKTQATRGIWSDQLFPRLEAGDDDADNRCSAARCDPGVCRARSGASGL